MPKNAIDISELSATAIQLHELFTEFRKAGFTPDEAIKMIGELLRPGGRS